MRHIPLLILLATLGACHGSAADIKASPPAPGHVLATFTLEEEPFCESCTGRLHQELDGLPGISSVDARIGDHTLRVWHDAQTMPADKILALLNAAGEKASQP
jgi:hypothetical protein